MYYDFMVDVLEKLIVLSLKRHYFKQLVKLIHSCPEQIL